MNRGVRKMKERINAIGPSIAERFVLSAISQVLSDRDVFEKNFKDRGGDGVEVELKINGVSLSFTSVINDWWKRMSDRREEDVREAAIKMVTEAGLEPVARALQNAERAVVEAIEQVTYVSHL